MQQKRQKLLLKTPKTLQKSLKTTETDTNSVFIGLGAESGRLQKSVTWPKKVKYGISRYQIFKFWLFGGRDFRVLAGPKK